MRQVELTYKIDHGNMKILCYYPDNTEKQGISMKIESLKIENVGGISNLSLDTFNPNLNIICGENGIGKTNILDSIAHCFSSYSKTVLRKKAGSEKGEIQLVSSKNIDNPFVCVINTFEPRDNSGSSHPIIKNKAYSEFLENNSPYLIYFKTERMFSYKWIERLNIYEQKEKHLYNLDGVLKESIKDWFIKCELLSKQEYTQNNDSSSIQLAKTAFSILNELYSFSAMKKDMEIYINTPSGQIPYEYLSSGFKTCIFIIWGIIKEIQIRFPDIYVKDFDGVILIDEIELHLHPEWQSKICNALLSMFPDAQFIVTTHSPHVVQSAEADQVIALSGQDGNLEKRTLNIAPYGFKGWTIEEILTDVMGMKDTRTEWFRNKQKEFDEALDTDDISKANEIFDELRLKLHPDSTDLALSRFQLDMLNGRNK